LYTPGGAVLQTSTAATVDPVNTTLDASAYAGSSTAIPLTSTANIKIGRSYLITSASTNQAEWVRVVAISDGVNVTVSEPIQYLQNTGSTFTGTRISYSISGALVNTRDRGYRAEWEYTVDGVTKKSNTVFDVVRRVWPDTILSSEEFKTYTDQSADIYQASSGIGEDFRPEIARATEDIKTAIMARGYELDQFIDPFSFKPAIARRVITNWAATGKNIPGTYQDDPIRFFELCEELSDRALTEALQTNRTYDEGDDDSIGSEDRNAKLGAVRFTR
jgi:hypothetical protein